MKHTITKVVGSSAAIAVLALGGAAAPVVAKSKHHHHKAHAKRHTTNSSSKTQETPLTGDTLTSASNAALAAVPGGTVDRATTEHDSLNSSAAHEVHVTKSDGTHVVVIEDSSLGSPTDASTHRTTASGAAGAATLAAPALRYRARRAPPPATRTRYRPL